jgi:hypothetical protein
LDVGIYEIRFIKLVISPFHTSKSRLLFSGLDKRQVTLINLHNLQFQLLVVQNEIRL